jgi:SAM-dependent methyltransferase
MRLNIGCGPRILDGFVNVDLENNWSKVKPQVVADISKPLPFETESADEIHAYHVFEHFYRYDADAILADWVRVLRPGGLLVLELPCLDKIIGIINYHTERRMAPPVRLTLLGLYGDPGYRNPDMCHRWCYSFDELTTMMEKEGLKVEEKPTQTHQTLRDMRLEGVKGML